MDWGRAGSPLMKRTQMCVSSRRSSEVFIVEVPCLAGWADDVAQFLNGTAHPAKSAGRGGAAFHRSDPGYGYIAAQDGDLDVVLFHLAQKSGQARFRLGDRGGAGRLGRPWPCFGAS